MLDYTVLLCLSVLLSLAFAAMALALLVRRLVKPLPAPVTPVHIAADGPVLNYEIAPGRPPLLSRWPWLLAPAAIVIGAIPFAAMTALVWLALRTIYFGTVFSSSGWPMPLRWAIAVLLYFLGSLIVCAIGLRPERNQQRAAARWRVHRLLGVIALACVALLVAIWVVDLRAGAFVRQVIARSQQRVEAIPRRMLLEEFNGQALYEQAAKAYSSGTPITWTIDIAKMEPWVPPPAIPANQLSTLALMQQGSQMEIDMGGFTTRLRQPFVTEGCTLLQVHAINAALAGDFVQATTDIATIQRQAQQLAPGPSELTSAAGMAGNGFALRTIQGILPLVRNEQQLDSIALPDRQWYREAGRRCAQAGLAYGVHGLSLTLDGRGIGGATLPPRFLPGIRIWRDVGGTDRLRQFELHHARMLACWDLTDDCALAQALAGELAQAANNVLRLEPINKLIERDLTEAAIAATRYRLRHGRLPNSWEELTSAGLLKTVPLDLFTGKPATMKVAPDHVLFSAGNIKTIAASRPLWKVFGDPESAGTAP